MSWLKLSRLGSAELVETRLSAYIESGGISRFTQRRLMKTFYAALALALSLGLASTPTFASEGCYVCKPSVSKNSCEQCAYGSKDTQEARKACEKRGCKISGTASCNTDGKKKTC